MRPPGGWVPLAPYPRPTGFLGCFFDGMYSWCVNVDTTFPLKKKKKKKLSSLRLQWVKHTYCGLLQAQRFMLLLVASRVRDSRLLSRFQPGLPVPRAQQLLLQPLLAHLDPFGVVPLPGPKSSS